MKVSTNATRLPVAFVSHGGGPSFFIETRPGDRLSDISKGSEAMKSLEQLPKLLGAERPNAIVMVTAHWERYATPLLYLSTLISLYLSSYPPIISYHPLVYHPMQSNCRH